jgi:hypothetical protein
MKMVNSPRKMDAVRVLESQAALMTSVLNVREGLDMGDTASTAHKVPPVGAKSAHTKVPMASLNQAMHLTTTDRVVRGRNHWHKRM